MGIRGYIGEFRAVLYTILNMTKDDCLENRGAGFVRVVMYLIFSGPGAP